MSNAPPYPITADNIDELKRQIWELIREIFEERIGGLQLGDVLIDSGGVLTLSLYGSSSGLQKISNALRVEIKPAGGIQATALGLSLKKQTHEADAAAVSAITVSAGADSINRGTLNTALGTLVTEINGIKTTLNNVMAKLESAEVLASS